MRHALAASCYLADAACVHASCVHKHATSARICGSYLWPASLPKEPVVRRGLEGLTQVGSGVFCTSVLTSGSISEGEGVSLAPAMALCLPSATSSEERESGQCVFSCCQNRLTQRPTPPENRIPVSLLLHEGGGRASPSLPHHGVLRHSEESSSLAPGYRALLHP